MRFAVANWLQAAWAVCFVSAFFFRMPRCPLPALLGYNSSARQGRITIELTVQTLQFFKGAEVILLINTINLYVYNQPLLALISRPMTTIYKS